jgi:hypothetical protein
MYEPMVPSDSDTMCEEYDNPNTEEAGSYRFMQEFEGGSWTTGEGGSSATRRASKEDRGKGPMVFERDDDVICLGGGGAMSARCIGDEELARQLHAELNGEGKMHILLRQSI